MTVRQRTRLLKKCQRLYSDVGFFDVDGYNVLCNKYGKNVVDNYIRLAQRFNEMEYEKKMSKILDKYYFM